MTEKEIAMARQAGRICRNLQAENQRLRERLNGDPEMDRADAEAFAMVRRHRGVTETQSRVYQARPAFDYENPVEMECGESLVFLDDAEEPEEMGKRALRTVIFCWAVALSVGIWLARGLNWVDGTTAMAVTVILAVAAGILGVR